MDNYILCYESGGTVSPQGNAKTYEYAVRLLAERRARDPKTNWKLYRLEKAMDPYTAGLEVYYRKKIAESDAWYAAQQRKIKIYPWWMFWR